MNESTALPPISPAEYEALRERWRLARANGMLDAFLRELIDGAVPVAPPAGAVYASEADRDAYAAARAALTPADLMVFLPLYFGDEGGVNARDLLRQLDDLGTLREDTDVPSR